MICSHRWATFVLSLTFAFSSCFLSSAWAEDAKTDSSKTASDEKKADDKKTDDKKVDDKKTDDKAAEKPAEKPPEKPAETKESLYNKPLNFDPGDIFPPAEFDYDLKTSNGKKLMMGPATLSEETLWIQAGPLSVLDPDFAKIAPAKYKDMQTLILKWPHEFVSGGTLEMISKSGKSIWQYRITEKEAKRWANTIQSWENAANGAKKPVPVPAAPTADGKEAPKEPETKNEGPDLSNSLVHKSDFGFINLAGYKFPLNIDETFRFCLSSVNGDQQTRLCSAKYGIKTEDKISKMQKVVEEGSARVLLYNEDAPLKKVVPLETERPLQFYAELKGGESYEMIVKFVKAEYFDIIGGDKGDTFKIVGTAYPPTEEHLVTEPHQHWALTKFLGFEATIGETRNFWSIELPIKNASYHFVGDTGGIFTQKVQPKDVPPPKARLFLHKNTIQSTYGGSPTLRVAKFDSADVQADAGGSVKPREDDPTLYQWDFPADKKAVVNRGYLAESEGGHSFKPYLELYRSYSFEASGRLTGILSSGGSIFMGEVAFNHWVEEIPGWHNDVFSTQRWGWSFKYFETLNKLTVDDVGDQGSLTTLTLDLKYRFTQGVWTRDESMGAMLDYQSVTLGSLAAHMGGIGWFWARSLPRSLDEVMNYVPYFRHPKWVDMELIYYAVPFDQGITLQSPLALNFHGQILFTPQLFGEAGFGLKRYAFTDNNKAEKAELNTFYTTLGIGFKF